MTILAKQYVFTGFMCVIFIMSLITMVPVESLLYKSQKKNQEPVHLDQVDSSSNMKSPTIEVDDAPPLESFFQRTSGIRKLLVNTTKSTNETMIKQKQSEDDNSDLVINLDTEKRTYSPGTQINIKAQVTRDFLPQANVWVNIEVYDRELWWWYAPFYIDDSYWEPPQLITLASVQTNSEGIASFSFTPTFEGTYTITANIQGTSDDWRYYDAKSIQVSSLACTWRVPWTWSIGDEIRSYVVVTDTVNFQPIENADVSVTYYDRWDNENTTGTVAYQGKSSSSGLAEMTFTIPQDQMSTNGYGYAVLNVSLGTSFVVLHQWIQFLKSTDDYGYYYSTNNWKGLYETLVTTDKPIYQPGQEILVRGLVWEHSYQTAVRKPAPNTEVVVLLRDPEAITIFRRILYTNSEGIVSFSVELDEDAMIGDYELSFITEGCLESKIIPVQKYQRPAFRITLDVPKFMPPGSSVSGNLFAEFYFGKPVQGTYQCTYYLSSSTVPVKTFSGELDGEGYANLESYVIPYNNDDYWNDYLTINATVTDQAGRSVSATETISLRSELSVWGWISPYYPSIGDNLTFYGNVYAYDSDARYYYFWGGIPVDAELTLTFYDMNTKQLLFSTTAEAVNGYCRHEIMIPESISKLHRDVEVVIIARTADGRYGESYWNPQIHFKTVDLDIIVPTTTPMPGDSFQLTIQLQNKFFNSPITGSVEVTIYDSDYDWIGKTTLEIGFIDSGMKSFTVQLSDYAPLGRYSVYAVLLDAQGNYWWQMAWDWKTFNVGTASQLLLSTNKTETKPGDSVTLTTEVQSTTETSPLYFEINKRGILSIEAIPEPTGTINLAIDYEHVPAITVYAFTIDSKGRFLVQQLEIKVNFEVQVSITSDKEVYAPGETATFEIEVTDQDGNHISASAGISLIDSSVYGVQADDESEMEFFEDQDIYSIVSGRISWFSPEGWFPWWFFYGDSYWGYEIYPLTYSNWETADTAGSGPPGEIYIRRNQPESFNWIPNLAITGSTTLIVQLPDNIGEWTFRAVVTSHGKGTVAKTTIKSFLDFFAQIKSPLFALQDDVIKISAIVFNYGTESIADISLVVDSNYLVPLVHPKVTVLVTSPGMTIITWSVLVLKPGTQEIVITAVAQDGRTDGVAGYCEIKPNAVRFETFSSGVVNNTFLTYEIYPDAEEITATLTVYPGLPSVSLDGWERLVGYPYGCVEQTMSRMLGSLTVYNYLLSAGELDNTSKAEFENWIWAGIGRLIAMRQPSGGWGWWYDGEYSVYMTSYVLYGLALANDSGFEINSEIFEDAESFLQDHQQADGSWIASKYGWSIDSTDLTAHIARSLAFAYRTGTTFYKAVNFLENQWNAHSANAYFTALTLQTLVKANTKPSLQSTLVTWLTSNYNIVNKGIYWGDLDYWYSLGGPVETTGTVISALIAKDGVVHLPLIERALNWLMSRQRRWGWGTTSDTAAAIKALTDVLQFTGNEIDAELSIEETGTAEIITKHIIQFNESSPATRIHLNVQVGINYITMNQTGNGTIFYRLEVIQYVRNELSADISIIQTESNQFSIDLQLTAMPTNPAVPITVTVRPVGLPSTVQLISDEIVFFPIIESEATATFLVETSTTAPVIGGLEVQYGLAERNDLDNLAPGLIWRIHGPIVIQEQGTPKTGQKMPSKSMKSQAQQDIVIERSYSKTTDLLVGEVVTVDVSIRNTGSEEFNYLFVKEPLMPGFELDIASLATTADLPRVTPKMDHVAFFIPKLTSNQELKFSYRIQITQNVAICAAGTTVEEMYGTKIFQGSSTVLKSFASEKIFLDPLTGKLSTDNTKFELESFEAQVEVKSNKVQETLQFDYFFTENVLSFSDTILVNSYIEDLTCSDESLSIALANPTSSTTLIYLTFYGEITEKSHKIFTLTFLSNIDLITWTKSFGYTWSSVPEFYDIQVRWNPNDFILSFTTPSNQYSAGITRWYGNYLQSWKSTMTIYISNRIIIIGTILGVVGIFAVMIGIALFVDKKLKNKHKTP